MEPLSPQDLQPEALTRDKWIPREAGVIPQPRISLGTSIWGLSSQRMPLHQILYFMTSTMHATFEALVLYHSMSRRNIRESWRYECHCSRLSHTIVYIIPRPSLLILFATAHILFSQTPGIPSFSCFCLLPVNIRKRFATSYVKHHARNYTYKSANCSTFSSLSTWYILILLLQLRISAKERKEQYPISDKSLSHFKQKDIRPKHSPRR